MHRTFTVSISSTFNDYTTFDSHATALIDRLAGFEALTTDTRYVSVCRRPA